MKKYILSLFFSLLILIEIVNCSSPLKESNICQIRIDKYCRIWWNMRVPYPDNLPKLISNNHGDSLIQNDYKVYEKLTLLIKESINNNNKLVLLIYVHPESHYQILDNIIFIKNKIEQEIHSELASKRGCLVDSLPKDLRYRLRYGIRSWSDRENKILDVASKEANIILVDSTICDKEFQFFTKFNDGFWKGKIPDELFSPSPIPAPKVGQSM